jgi:hypothetical protein
LAHVQPNLGDDDLGGVAADPVTSSKRSTTGRGQPEVARFAVDQLGAARRQSARLDASADGRCGATAWTRS